MGMHRLAADGFDRRHVGVIDRVEDDTSSPGWTSAAIAVNKAWVAPAVTVISLSTS